VCLINGNDDLWVVIHSIALGKSFDKVIVGFGHDVVSKVQLFYESHVN